VIVRGAFRDFFLETMLPALQITVVNAYKRRGQQWSRIFAQDTVANGGVLQASQISGVGLARQITEGADVEFDTPVQGFDKTYKPVRYGLGIQVSQDTVEDDQKARLVPKLAQMLSWSIAESIEIQAASVINNGFTAGAYAGPDAVALFSASHPLVKAGGVENNLLSAAADFDNESLALALTDYETMVNAEGKQMLLPTPKVIVAPENRWAVAEVIESKMRSDTANNATNPLGYAEGGMPEWMVWNYLTDPDSWFLIAPPGNSGLLVVWRRKPYIQHGFEEKSETGWTAMRYKMDVGFHDFYGAYGVAGA
jgi:hypothetical protein